MKIIILAGGMGTRLRDVVKNLPKPMADINGRPFLEYLMENMLQYGTDEFVLCVGHMREIIMDHYNDPSNKTTPKNPESFKNIRMDSTSCIDDITIYLKTENNVTYVFGDNFTPNSKVVVNKKVINSEYISKTCLKVKDYIPKPKDIFISVTFSNKNSPLNSSNLFEFLN